MQYVYALMSDVAYADPDTKVLDTWSWAGEPLDACADEDRDGAAETLAERSRPTWAYPCDYAPEKLQLIARALLLGAAGDDYPAIEARVYVRCMGDASRIVPDEWDAGEGLYTWSVKDEAHIAGAGWYRVNDTDAHDGTPTWCEDANRAAELLARWRYERRAYDRGALELVSADPHAF